MGVRRFARRNDLGRWSASVQVVPRLPTYRSRSSQGPLESSAAPCASGGPGATVSGGLVLLWRSVRVCCAIAPRNRVPKDPSLLPLIATVLKE